MFPDMQKIVPEGERGIARVRHYTVTPLNSMQDAIHGVRTDPGPIAILLVDGKVMMSDTWHERHTNIDVAQNAKGNVLIAGLGLGMILHTIVKKPEVKRVTVVEKYKDVIDLIGPTLPKSKKLVVVNADIFEWVPPEGTKYDTIYFDIWADASNGKAAPDKRKLIRRFRAYKAPGCWMRSWKPMRRFS